MPLTKPAMSTLSAKARAFSMDYLLHSDDSQSSRETDSQSPQDELVCSSMGDGPVCCHDSVYTFNGDNQDSKVRIELCQNELWDAFHSLGTEMIITKTGRRMFPALRVRVTGLKKQAKYRLYLDFIPVDRNKYRYVYHSSKWMISGTGENLVSGQLYLHPDSPMDGSFITSQVISFERVKLTNHNKPKYGQISLISMQKYQPRIHVEEIKEGSVTADNKYVASFPQTAFIAVTAYQNQEITRLKIARNPFAKGFREAGKCRSSLEAMMASFGVVIDSNDSSNQKKRRIMPEDSDLASSPKKILHSDSLEYPIYSSYTVPQYSSLPMQAFKTITPPKAHCHPLSTLPLHVSPYPATPFVPVVLSPAPSLLTHSISSSSSSNSNIQLPPNIHPAFRPPSIVTQLSYSADPKWTFYNPLASIMCLQPAKFVTSPLSAITKETNGSDNEEEVDAFEDKVDDDDDDNEDIEVV